MENDEFMEEKKRKPYGKIILRVGLILSIICGIGAVIYLVFAVYRSHYGTFKNYSVIHSVERNDSNSTEYKRYGELLLKYSRDGATAMNVDGQYIWDGSYEMKDPVVDICGDYVVVGDRGGKLVHIFNEGGAVSSITVDHPILSVQVANQGVVAVLMEEENIIHVVLYKPKGTVIADVKRDIKATGFPLSMALSNDGKKLVLSFADIMSGTLKTNIACYNFDEVGRNESENFVGGNIFEKEVVAKVDFVTNDVVCMYKDSGFVLYHMEQKLSEKPIIEETFETSIQSVFSSSSYIGFVLDTAEQEYKYNVVVYDLKGNKVLQKGFNFDYSNISMYGSDILFTNYSECMVMNLKGTIRFEYRFEQSIDAMFGVGNNRYYLVQGNNVQIIGLKGAK